MKQEQQSTLSLLKRVLQFGWAHRRYFAISALLIPIAAGLQLLQPYTIKIIIDRYIANAHVQGIVMGSIVYLLLFVGEAIVNFGQIYFINFGSQHALKDMRSTLFGKALSLPVRFFDKNATGTVVARITDDVEAINDLFVSGVVSLLKDVLVLTAIIGMMLYLNFKLALLSFILIPFLMIVTAWLQNDLRRAYRKIRRVVGRLNGLIGDSVSGIAVVKLFQREASNLRDMNKLSEENMRMNFRSIRNDSVMFALVEVVGAVTVAGVIWFGSKMMFPEVTPVQGALSFGTLVAFIEYLNRFFTPLRELSSRFSVIQSALASSERIDRLLNESDELSEWGAVSEPVELAEAGQGLPIAFDRVRFGYTPDEVVLRNISFDVKPGERIAIVGPTGSGKTSIVRLLLGMYPYQEGSIQISGHSLQDYRLEDLRKLVGLIPQDVVLFDGSAAENIAMHAGPFSDDETHRMQAILQKIGLAKRFGLTDVIGERGYNLSAGEMQLVSFARALYANPQIMIMDEATSSIDPQTEKEILEAMELALEGRTSLVIAHRLSTIRSADRILVICCGKLIAEGSHDKLLETSSVYKALIEEAQKGHELTAPVLRAGA